MCLNFPGVWVRQSAGKKSPSVGNLIYHVVRKENSEPTSVHDGTTVVTTQNLTAEDRGGDVGHNYYYSIFTERNGVFSLHPGFPGNRNEPDPSTTLTRR